MAKYEHLPLRRLEGELQRRKRGGFAGFTKKDYKQHGASIDQKITDAIEAQKKKQKIAEIDPSLILKIKLDAPISEEEWSRVGLSVLATDQDQTLILFADDNELQTFKARVAAYRSGPADGKKNPQYDGFVTAIAELGQIDSIDRIGSVLKHSGITLPAHFSAKDSYLLDVELWQPSPEMAEIFTYRVATKLKDLGGKVISEYRGNAALLLRIEAKGEAIRGILELPEVASIDYPPLPDLPPEDLSEFTVEGLPNVLPPGDGAGAIGIVDSGITSAHPLLETAVIEAFGQPVELTDADEKGHGTPVSGIAIYGDLRSVLAGGAVAQRFHIASARVVNKHGRFDDKSLVPEQMNAAIRRLHAAGCTVINISLGDRSRSAANKPSAWAATLDDLARELDLVIVVSAGNSDRAALIHKYGDGIVAAYPEFLHDAGNKIFEPATAINVITVGSIASSNGLSEDDGQFVGIQPIAAAGQPSPFTRIGPGIGGMIKPDLVEFGGTALFDGTIQNLIDGQNRAAAGVISLHNLYLQRLLTSVSGTSFSAPLVAYKAALIREAFPHTTANFTRALLALCAEYPEPAVEALGNSQEKILDTMGYGHPNIENALSSDDSRVILYREDALAIDKFAIYEIPVPTDFQKIKGRRQIKVSLAYDPPVRHTRLDYAGIEMSFELVRGTSQEEVFDHFRKWEKDEGEPFKVTGSKRCAMKPGSQKREKGSLQCATFHAMTNIERYGDTYFLAVRCEGGWAAIKEQNQRFAVFVELRHEGAIELYQRVQERVRIRATA